MEFLLFLFLLWRCFCLGYFYESDAWCGNTENYTTGAVTVNQIIMIIIMIKKTTSQPRGGTTLTCKHSPQVIIQVLIIRPVHYAEQSFSYCHTVITLSLCSPLLQIISITDNLNVMRVARAKRFSQWPITLPPCWVCLYSPRPKERLNQFTYMQRKKKGGKLKHVFCFH